MKKSNGYSKLQLIGERICSTINNAIKNVDICDYMECVSVFNSAMFDIKFSNKIVNDKNIRDKLGRFLVDEGIILLQGHPSFVCLAHESIEYEELGYRLNAAFLKWKKCLATTL